MDCMEIKLESMFWTDTKESLNVLRRKIDSEIASLAADIIRSIMLCYVSTLLLIKTPKST